MVSFRTLPVSAYDYPLASWMLSLCAGLGLLGLILAWHGAAGLFGLWLMFAAHPGGAHLFRVFLLWSTLLVALHLMCGLWPFRWLSCYGLVPRPSTRQRLSDLEAYVHALEIRVQALEYALHTQRLLIEDTEIA